MTAPDHYATLGVARNASAREIRAARKRLLGIHHPDVSEQGGEEARKQTIAILLAGEVLLDAKTREAYDGELARAEGREAFEERARSGSRARERAGRDLACPACGKLNVRTQRDYCIFCGAGIGANPRPITLRPLRRAPERSDPTGVHAGCGCLFGLFVGATLMAHFAGSLAQAIAFICAPAIIFAVLAHRHRDGFWNRIVGIFRPND